MYLFSKIDRFHMRSTRLWYLWDTGEACYLGWLLLFISVHGSSSTQINTEIVNFCLLTVQTACKFNSFRSKTEEKRNTTHISLLHNHSSSLNSSSHRRVKLKLHDFHSSKHRKIEFLTSGFQWSLFGSVFSTLPNDLQWKGDCVPGAGTSRLC